MIQPVWNFEQEPFDEPPDETAINLRAYFDRMADEKMRQYSPAWGDDRLDPYFVVSATVAQETSVVIPALRFVCRPEVSAFEGTEKITAG